MKNSTDDKKACKFKMQSMVAMSTGFGRDAFTRMHLKENALFDLDFKVKVTPNIAQYPLHHVTYAPTTFGSCYIQWFRRHIYKKRDRWTADG